MAHMLVAGLSSRGIGFLSLHRCSWQVCCKSSQLFVVGGHIRPAIRRELPRSTPRAQRAPQRYVLKCEVSDPSPSSSRDDEAVIISSKECPDGSILFTFGSPAQQQQALTEVNADSGVAAKEEDEKRDDATASGLSSGSVNTDDSLSNRKAAIFSSEDTNQAEPRALTESKGKVHIDPALATEQVKSVQSEKHEESAIEKQEVPKLHSGGAMRPHPSKVATGGEDAYIIEGTTWVGVADGVGGWALSGIDSGLYSRELLSHCGLLARSQTGVPNPKEIIIKGVKQTEAVGSCTAVLAALHKQTLYLANVGDSGFIVVRNGKILAKSSPMQHGFNFPYQIGSEGDDPATAETFEVPVTVGDVLVLATDGVFDNLYEREIVDMVDAGHKKGVEPATIAMWIVKLAHQAGLNSSGRSPFSDAAKAEGYKYEGGKLDDATAVVSYVE